MNRRQIATRSVLRHVAGGIGLLLVGFGTFLIASYVVGAVQVLDEADRSWLFWGLALAAQGVAIAGLGGLLVAWGHLSGRPAGEGDAAPAAVSDPTLAARAMAPASAALHVLGPDDEVAAVVE